MNSSIQISQSDYNTIQNLLAKQKAGTAEEQQIRDQLFRELMRARVTPGTPPDVIALNSRARLLDIANREEMEFTLVLPAEADVDAGRISIFAPLGTAMLGFRAGDNFQWTMPGGTLDLKVLEVTPPPTNFPHAGHASSEFTLSPEREASLS